MAQWHSGALVAICFSLPSRTDRCWHGRSLLGELGNANQPRNLVLREARLLRRCCSQISPRSTHRRRKQPFQLRSLSSQARLCVRGRNTGSLRGLARRCLSARRTQRRSSRAPARYMHMYMYM